MFQLSEFSDLCNPEPYVEDPHTERIRTSQRSLGWLIQRIGFPAASLYGVLIGYRDIRAQHAASGQGPVWASNASLRARMSTTHGCEGKRSVSESTFKRAVRTLRDCGFIEHDRWGFGHADLRMLGHVPRGTSRYGTREGTAVRIVCGRIRNPGNGTRVVDVPAETLQVLEKAGPLRYSARANVADEYTMACVRTYRKRFNRGGTKNDGVDWETLREGMGPRPAGSGLGFIVDPHALPWPRGLEAVKRHAAGVFSVHNCRWVTRAEQLRDARGASGLIVEARANPAAFRAERVREGRTKLTPLANQTDPLVPLVKTESHSKENEIAENPLNRIDRKKPMSLTWVPGYPLTGAIVISAPPRLRDDMTDEEKVRGVVTAYRAACEKCYGSRSFAFARGDIRKSKHFPRLLKAAEACIEHDIEPHGWAAFSMGQIEYARGSKGKAPPITVVFALSRIAKHNGWYRTDRAAYAQVGITPESLRELVRDWEECQAALMRDPSDETVLKYFPQGRKGFEHRLTCVRSDALEIKRNAEAEASRGRWVW